MDTGAMRAVTALRGAYRAFADCDLEALTRAELLAVMDEYETLTCQLPAQTHRMLARLQADNTPKELGAKSWNEVLRARWRLSTADAGRRLGEAVALGPRRTLTGEALPPTLAAVAAAQAAGLINADHVKVLREAINSLPGFVDVAARQTFEVELVRLAVSVGPKELKDSAEFRLFLLDQDGPEPDDAERERKRGVTVGKQGRDAMTPMTANLSPEAYAVWEVLFAKFAAPGMCNPDDDEPCVSGTPTQAQIDNDHRTLAQRQHDAMLVVGRMALMSGDLGQLNGLPVSVIIRTTLQDLESRAGIGVTGGGTKIPIKDVIRMAAHANHHLAVFDKATGSALNHFRARRTASPGQRIMLIARDGGCTKPCCTKGFYYCQAHHAKKAFADGGNTNVDELTLACGWDNRLVHDDGGYTTTVNDHCVVEWHPPPDLDNGQARVNYYHRPELLVDSLDEGDTAECLDASIASDDDAQADAAYEFDFNTAGFDDGFEDDFDVSAVIAANADILCWTEPWDPWRIPEVEFGAANVRGP
ncbi:HNH endonuclease signature motif containing protein [Mycobacterium sp. AMU20-3851]|uniref:HNH endonuclease signature motif containing protein n=1 Tax=Mycobacterium sp. AMU20-3851 TaxID=3122055 RepID=UPI0037551264